MPTTPTTTTDWKRGKRGKYFFSEKLTALMEGGIYVIRRDGSKVEVE
jgi:hypothetical protein